MRRAVAAIDVGGTRARIGAVDADGLYIAGKTFEIRDDRRPDVVTARLARAVGELAARPGVPRLEAVGVSTPGPLDAAAGVVHLSPNLGWREYPLGERLSTLSGLPVVIDDDANCAAVGEAWMGAGRGIPTFVLLVVGSGIGAGIMIEGRLYRGAHNSAGEIGHVPLVPDGPECGCGKRGCLESLASGRAMEGADAEAGGGGGRSAEAVYAAAEAGDGHALRVLEEAGAWLGRGLAIIANVLDPGVVIIGGGLGLRGGQYLERALGVLRESALELNSANLRVLPAALGDRSGLYGAAALALERSG